MAKRRSVKRRSHNRGSGKIPIAIVAGFLPGAFWVWDAASQGNMSGAGSRAVAAYTGYVTWAKAWDFNHLWKGAFPLLGGILLHTIANRFGINRWIAKARLPVEI